LKNGGILDIEKDCPGERALKHFLTYRLIFGIDESVFEYIFSGNCVPFVGWSAAAGLVQTYYDKRWALAKQCNVHATG
jgi:hypothetical protein